ncbi:MAG: WG repeat-containing protein [Candidatus Obscuribacter sp.]|nr:WG repeat-containing protein [Candidatus Obscuribacter sp.]
MQTPESRSQVVSALKQLLVLASLFLIESPGDFNDFVSICSGDKYALVNQNGQSILPLQYGNIEYLGHGLYYACNIRPEDKFVFGDARLIFNREGKTQRVLVPRNATLSKVLWLGARTEKADTEIFSVIPDDSLFRFRIGNNLGICDKRGKIVAPAIYNRITDACDGKIFLQRIDYGGVHMSVLDATSREVRNFKRWNLEELESISVGDGLICFRDLSSHSSAYRYIDIEENCPFPQTFENAQGFYKGMAIVSPSSSSRGVCIDKTGAVISPASLNVLSFYGELGLVSTEDGTSHKFGLVDRQFRTVLPLEYDSIHPTPDLYGRTVGGMKQFYRHNALHYACYKNGDRLAYLYDGTGKFLFSFPSKYQFEGFTVDGRGQFFQVTNGGLGKKEISILDVSYSGQKKRPSLASLPGTLREYEPDRFVQRISTDTGHFDPVHWKHFHNLPVSREEMFARLLRDYNLIGMSRQKVHELLGKNLVSMSRSDESYTYHLARACVADHTPTVRLQFLGDEVVSWTLSLEGKEGKPITVNVVLDENTLKDYSKSVFERYRLLEKN